MTISVATFDWEDPLANNRNISGSRKLLVHLAFWFAFLAIIAFSLLVIHVSSSVLLGVGAFMGLLALMGWVSLRLRRGEQSQRIGGKTVISARTSRGPKTSLTEFPLLYLYFDDFAELRRAWEAGCFEAARHDADARSRDISIQDIMKNEYVFLKSYREDLLRIRLDDGTVLCRDFGEQLWERATSPGKEDDVFGALTEERRRDISGLLQVYDDISAEIDQQVEALKRRYEIND